MHHVDEKQLGSNQVASFQQDTHVGESECLLILSLTGKASRKKYNLFGSYNLSPLKLYSE